MHRYGQGLWSTSSVVVLGTLFPENGRDGARRDMDLLNSHFATILGYIGGSGYLHGKPLYLYANLKILKIHNLTFLFGNYMGAQSAAVWQLESSKLLEPVGGGAGG